MLLVTFDEARSIITLEPDNSLTVEDFRSATRIIDDHLALGGKLTGIVIRTDEFPGWQTFQAFLGHLKFVKDHHQWVKHVALVTNSLPASLVEPLIQHFVNARIKQFRFDEIEHALSWILSDVNYEYA